MLLFPTNYIGRFPSTYIIITLIQALISSWPHLLLDFYSSFWVSFLAVIFTAFNPCCVLLDLSRNITEFFTAFKIKSQPTYIALFFITSNSTFHTFSISYHIRYPYYAQSSPPMLILLPDTFISGHSLLKLPNLECSSLSLSNYSVLISTITTISNYSSGLFPL